MEDSKLYKVDKDYAEKCLESGQRDEQIENLRDETWSAIRECAVIREVARVDIHNHGEVVREEFEDHINEVEDNNEEIESELPEENLNSP